MDSTRINIHNLLPQEERPVPLPLNFEKIFVNENPPVGIKLEDLFELSRPRRNEEKIQAAVEEIVEKSEAVIREAADKIAASSATTPKGEIYHNLVSTSFDEQQFLDNAEEELERQRLAAKRVLRRSNP